MPRNDWYFSKPGKSSFKCIVNFNFYQCYPNNLKTCINKQNCKSEGHFWLNFLNPKFMAEFFFYNSMAIFYQCMCFCRVYNIPKMPEVYKISDFLGDFWHKVSFKWVPCKICRLALKRLARTKGYFCGKIGWGGGFWG